MIGLASMIRSPSTLSSTLSTTCVDGCWGPKFTSISWTSNMFVVRGSLFVVREPRSASHEQRLQFARGCHQLSQFRFRLRLARHAQGHVFRFALVQRGGVAFAIPSAGGAVGLGHGGEE